MKVYPIDGWDSFGTIAEIEDYIEKYSPNPNWALLDKNIQKVYLRQATALINSCPTLTLPEDTEEGLQIAQAICAVYVMDNDLTEYDANERAINFEAVDTLKTAYDVNRKRDGMVIPPFALSYLRQYGCTQSSGGFSQGRVGRS